MKPHHLSIMSRISTALITAALSFITLISFAFSTQASENVVNGEKIYQRACATCHGKSAEKQALGKSAVIGRLKTQEIITALSERKSGKIEGAGNAVKSRLTEQEMKAVAEYIQTLKHKE